MQLVGTYETVEQLGDDDGVCSRTLVFRVVNVRPLTYSPLFILFFVYFLRAHLHTRPSGFMNVINLFHCTCLQDVITDKTVEQQGYEDWVCLCSFLSSCFKFTVSLNINYVCTLLCCDE